LFLPNPAPRRRFGNRAKFLAITVLTAIVGSAFVGMDGARWRLEVVALKVTGQLRDISWLELSTMMSPSSRIYVGALRDNPNPYAVIRNPYTSEEDRAAGGELFRAKCAGCHGATAEGGPYAPMLVGRPLRIGDSDWAIYRAIKRGTPGVGMPAVDIGELGTWRVVTYLRSMRSGLDNHGSPKTTHARVGSGVSASRLENAPSNPGDWLMYSGRYQGWRYSTLEEINRSNVARTELAWALQLGTAAEFVEATPVIVDEIMYLTAPPGDVLAVDAGTGEVLWRKSRQLPTDMNLCCGAVNRGVAVLNNRIFAGTLDAHLVALNAADGSVAWETEVADYKQGYSITSAPLAARDLIIIGVSGGEFGIRGFVDAYDAATGERRWRFYTIPAPGEPGSETWGGDSWKIGGGPTWLTGSFDPDLGLLYWGVGNPSPDFNGDVRPGDNLFTASVVALEVATGKLRWHFQFTPHDQHDWDSNQIPILADLPVNGETQRLMLWANRNGFYYVLDRATGQFLHGSPYVKQNWAERLDDTGRPVLTATAAPTIHGTLTWPGLSGGANWWSPSFNPQSNLVYVPFADAPKIFFKNGDLDADELKAGEVMLGSVSFNTGDPLAVGIKALDPLTGEIAWEYLRARPRTNLGYIGGTLTTAGGLVFFGDMTEFVAVDAKDGAPLWRINLGGNINASPTTFVAAGSQRIAIPAGNTLYVFRGQSDKNH